jgi:glutathione S-transferase
VPHLWPTGPAARAAARLLELQSDEVYFPHIIRLMGLQASHDDPAAVASRKGASEYYLKMEALLTNREWLAGDYSFADIAFYMAALFGERMGAVLGPETPNLLAWRERMTARPAVLPVVSAMARYLSTQGRPVPNWLDSIIR